MKRRETQLGASAFCRRAVETRVLKAEEVRGVAQQSLEALGQFFESLPEALVAEEEVETQDLSFREGFHEWLREVKCSGEAEEDDSGALLLHPKKHPRKERVLKEPLPMLDADKGEAEESMQTFGVEAIVEEAGNVLRSRVSTPRPKRKKGREVDSEDEGEPDGQTVKDVRLCIEKLASELSSPLEMIAQKNTNLHGAPFRQNLFRMYRRIAMHLEECEGRVFVEPNRQRSKAIRRLDPSETESVKKRIEELETRLGSIRESRFFRHLPSPATEEGGAYACHERLEEVPAALNSAGVTDVTDDVVIEIEMGTHVMARGRHSLRDVIELCTCTCDNTMTALEETSNPRYVFIEGVFYVDDDDNDIILKDIESIKEFCRGHGSRWPLDVVQGSFQDFQIASLQTKLDQIPLRASNKPLYLYVHRGACEHLLRIVNIRMAHVKDLPGLAVGPVRTHSTHVTIRKCSICEKLLAAYVVYGSGMNITDPCFYCETCYHLGHFDAEGNETPVAAGHIAFPYRGG